MLLVLWGVDKWKLVRWYADTPERFVNTKISLRHIKGGEKKRKLWKSKHAKNPKIVKMVKPTRWEKFRKTKDRLVWVSALKS